MRIAGAFLLMLALTVGTGQSQAAVMKIMNLDQLAEESTAVVHGRVAASRVEWNPAHTSIVTIYTVKASRYLKGTLGGTFELTELGGQIGNLAMQASGAPHFQTGEEVVLFVWTDGIHHRHQAIGFEQGVFRVRQDPANGMKYVNRAATLDAAGNIAPEVRTAAGKRTVRELNAFLAQVDEAVGRLSLVRKTGVRP